MIDRLSLQTLRGLACLLLVFYHVLGGTSTQGLMISNGPWRVVNDAFVPLRMPLFALLAGAVWTLEKRQGWALVSDKFQRLWLPMLSVGTVFALVQTTVPGTSSEVTNWWSLHWMPVAHFWFLEALFLIFVVCALIPLRWRDDRDVASQQRVWALAMGVVCILYLSGWGVPWLGVAGALYLAPFFLWGVGLALWGEVWHKNLARRLRSTDDGVRAFLLVLAAGVAASSFWVTWELQDRRQWYLLAMGLLYASACWFSGLKSSWLAWLGHHSYAVFLFHVFFTAATRMALRSGGVTSIELHLVAGLLAGIAGPVATSKVLGRWPIAAKYLLGQRTYSRQPKVPA